MKIKRNCEFCNKEFEIRDKRQPGRFCSELCNRRVLRKNQLIKHNEYLINETVEQKIAWLKKHYEKFVIKKDGCWDWSGCKVNGYGHFGHRGKIMRAHRASWILHKGNIPVDMFVLHTCDNRSCSNPEHLFLGSHTDNMRDMASKLRTKIRCKLTPDQVREIKKLLSMGVTSVHLAKQYNVSDVAIHNIKHKLTWKHII